MHMAINHLGHVLLTHYFWNNILASVREPRIVHVSSLTAIASWRDASLGWYDPNPKEDMGKVYNFLDSIRYYSQSKRANLMHTWELHKRYKDLGVSSVTPHPGYSRSEIIGKVRLPLFPDWWKELLTVNPILSMSTEVGAKTQLLAAFAPLDVVPSGSHVVPKYWTSGRPIVLESLIKRFSTHFWTFSEKDSANLWIETLRELGISEFGKVQ
jgi:NAD(P)-dependent dehydrogenase (short-subunit alcohol dehydrogenase family)